MTIREKRLADYFRKRFALATQISDDEIIAATKDTFYRARVELRWSLIDLWNAFLRSFRGKTFKEGK